MWSPDKRCQLRFPFYFRYFLKKTMVLTIVDSMYFPTLYIGRFLFRFLYVRLCDLFLLRFYGPVNQRDYVERGQFT